MPNCLQGNMQMSCNKCKYLCQIVNFTNIEKKTYYSLPNQDFEAIEKNAKHCVYVFLAFAANCKSCKFMCKLVFDDILGKKYILSPSLEWL